MRSPRWNIPTPWLRPLQMGAGALGICLFFLLGSLFGWTARLEQGFFFLWSWSGTSVRHVYDLTFTSRSTLQRERDYYQTLSASLAQEAAEAARLKETVKNLEDAFHYVPQAEISPLLARITSRTNSPEETITVDQGSEEGVQIGDAAFIHAGQLVGTVAATWPHSSRIRLISDSNSHIPASILEQTTQTIGIVDGAGGYLLAMRFIPRDQPIAVGQIVATSGLDEHLSRGLILGVVSEIIQEDRALFQEAMVEPIFPIDQETHVFLLPQKEADHPSP